MPSSFPAARRYAWHCVAVAAIYFVVALCFLRFASVQANASPVWPTSGLAAGVMLVVSRRLWPGILLGALAVNLVTNLQSPREVHVIFSAAAAMGIAVGNALEAYCVAWLTGRFAGGADFLDQAFDFFRFVVLATLAPPAISAALGVGSLYLAGFASAEQLGEMTWTWYTGNLCGLLLVTPLLAAWRRPTPAVRKRPLFWLESAALFLGLLFVGQAICGIYFSQRPARFPRTYMVWPLLLWTSFRYGARGVTLCLLLLGTIAVAGTARGFQVFPADTANTALLYCQVFLAVLAVVSLAMTAVLKERANVRDHLEQTVAKRTAQLQKLIEEKQDLLLMTAHDLQTPIVGLRNLVELVERQPQLLTGPRGREVLDQIKQTCAQLIDWSERVMQIEQAEHLLSGMQVQPLDVVSVLQHEADFVRLTIGHPIEIRPPDDPLQAIADQACLRRVIGNLLSNAVRHSEPGTPIVAFVEQIGDRVRLAIANRGPVIPAQQTDRIFEKFARLRPREYNGDGPSHGVGLFIVQRLVEALDGEVQCTSSPAEGTVFSVTLKAPKDK